MNSLVKDFENYSSQYLLGRRALGEELTDEAHQAIEIVLNQRGVKFPPKPKSSIDVSKENFIGRTKKSPFEMSMKFAVGVIILFVTKAFAKTLAHTIFGFLFLIFWIAYCVFEFFRKANQSTEEKEMESKVKKIEEDGVSDLMLASAEGNLERVKDLIAYGADVNATSNNGSTSLMYAARNNHLNIVQFLIENGADENIKNEKKSTALSISESFKSTEVTEYLRSLNFNR
jgi:hypothetical protein